jgi:hypothetical protein
VTSIETKATSIGFKREDGRLPTSENSHTKIFSSRRKMSDEKKLPTAGNCEYRTEKDHKTEEQFRKSYDAYSWDVYRRNQR